MEEKKEKEIKENLAIKPQKESKLYILLENQIKSNIFSISLFLDFFIIFIKILVGQYGYSGEHDPPKYGDFEAQRHWMELAIYLPPEEWYTNSKLNKEKYWPLDYPPLSGYHSYILGKILNYFIPESVEFKYSHGYETKIFKNVMRAFALFFDFIIFHIAIHFFCYKVFIKDKINKNKKPLYMNYLIIQILILLNPLMIIIDHGHFQYNNIMHGFFVFAAFFLLSDKFLFSIIFLSFCVNYKQMGLYYALVFPFYVIKKLFFSEDKKNIFISLLLIIIYGIATVFINGIIYWPWIKNDKLKDVFNRIFPVKRGIFEDKVATFWCILNIFIKLNKKFKNNVLLKFSLVLTLLLGCIIPIFAIFKSKKITKKIIMQCFFIISLAFYLFSFHVHEKTIIVPFLAFLLNLPYMKNILPSFTLIGMFSLFPLLKRENQIIPYYLINVIFYLVTKSMNRFMTKKKKEENKYIFIFAEIIISCIMIGYHILEYKIAPPEKYPWFYPMINAIICFVFFFGIFLYSNYSLLKIIFKDKNK